MFREKPPLGGGLSEMYPARCSDNSQTSRPKAATQAENLVVREARPDAGMAAGAPR